MHRRFRWSTYPMGCLLLASVILVAAVAVADTEPNDTFAQAERIVSGAAV